MQILATTSDFVRSASSPPKSVSLQHQEEAGKVDWQTAMKRAIRSSDVLRECLDLPIACHPGGEKQFPTFVPLEFLSRIKPGNPLDPLLRQVLPESAEDNHQDARFVSDPVGDQSALVSGGLLHKYTGRALMITTGACGVHCRYCFRREFPYSENRPNDWSAALDHVRSRSDIDEVILSGGDPLTLVDAKLFDLIDQIQTIDHVKRLRIHSRMPIVIPQRLTDTLVSQLAGSRLATWFVVHANHANELDGLVLDRMSALIDAGIPVLNQAVLLRGVNDDVDTLADLSTRLINHRAMPYYLHQLDRVRGASHFEVPEQRGRQLIDELRQRLPGYAVPTYVVEQAGERSKTPLG